jgi:hypothetical protein
MAFTFVLVSSPVIVACSGRDARAEEAGHAYPPVEAERLQAITLHTLWRQF